MPIRTVFNDQTPTSAVAAAGSGVAAPGVTETGLMEVVEVSLGGNGHAGTRGVRRGWLGQGTIIQRCRS